MLRCKESDTTERLTELNGMVDEHLITYRLLIGSV